MGVSKISLALLLLGLSVLLGWLTYIIVGLALYFILWWGIRLGADIYWHFQDRR